MVFAEMKQICGRHCRNSLMQELPAKLRRRRGNGRLQQSPVAELAAASVLLNSPSMNVDDLLDG
jgi:hypothetical protein